ncbi:hypothetical protein A3D14_01510 [Candidatus Saccharibacteria bacterium RIFCSPHIGHO2_02_FULL_47_12]|nr:MAG: hypothetical protein A3D14_01510 [Candidatus Saccharibacteria bacterium RIFCSPHIGHO2_02_FULL_47_12]
MSNKYRNKKKFVRPKWLISTVSFFKQQWWGKGWWRRIWVTISVLVLLGVTTMYSIAQWYIWSNRDKPLHVGATFVPNYARYLGVDPKETFTAILDDLGLKRVRLVSYWNDIEKSPGQYDFSELDWQFKMAEERGVDVSLAIGLRQPRWPECHMPQWLKDDPKEIWYPQLKNVMKQTVERYKTSPALDSYQLENEFFLTVFGICPDFSRDRLIDEYNFVKSLDSEHPVIVSRSNNWVGVPIQLPTPDSYGVSVYKRIWDHVFTKRYLEYPFPAWYYAFYAGASKLLQGKDMIIHELQAEPWTPPGFNIKDAPVDELYKSLNPERLRNRFEYGRATGMKTIDMWGAEWWYQMKVLRGNPEVWNVAKEEISKANSAK